MKKILLLVVCCLAISVNLALAQTKNVQGVVVDETGEAIIGASVSVVGSNLGTVTDLDGNFTLSLPQSAARLKITYLGYSDVTTAITSGVMHIKMKSLDSALEEVVVTVAYGTQKRNALTGAVTSLGTKDIENRPVNSINSLLEGKLGIMTNSANENPTNNPTVRIRGFGSVNGNNDPLYVVDGFVFEGKLTDLNPSDILEMNVLKDASSAAVYGSRGANGIIIIATKKGNTDKPHISLSMNQGLKKRIFPDYERLKADEWMETTWKGYRNFYMSTHGNTLEEATAAANAGIISEYMFYNIYDKPNDQLFDSNGKLLGQIREGFKDDLDWVKAGTRDGYRSEYVVSGDGKLSNTSDYYFSLGYLDDQGYLPISNLKRFSGRAKINMSPVKWLKTGFNIAATDQLYQNGATSGGERGFAQYLNFVPIYPVHLHDMETGAYILDDVGNKIYDTGVANARPVKSDKNPIWENKLNGVDGAGVTRKTITGNIFGEISFLKDFKAKISGNLDSSFAQDNGYGNSITGDFRSQNGQVTITDNSYKIYTLLEQLNWAQTVYDNLSVDAMFAHENYSWNRRYAYIRKTNANFDGKPYLDNFNIPESMEGYEENLRMESFLWRIRFNYDEKYFLDGSIRRDGSSRFRRAKRWGTFFAVGAAWDISKEMFMEQVKEVNYLKFRVNYGELGNDRSVGLYAYMPLYKVGQNAGTGTLTKTQLGNADLIWEAQTSFGIALDGRVFDRFNFSVEYFDKRSRDLLFSVSLPTSGGATASDSANPKLDKNIGQSSNRGVELNLTADIIRKRDFVWHATLDVTALKNKILSLPPENRAAGILNDNNKFMEGHDMHEFWTYIWAGVDQMSGRSLYELNTNDFYVADVADPDDTRTFIPANQDQLSAKDKQVIRINGKDYAYKTTYAKRDFCGSPIPKFSGSFSTGINYKGIGLDVLLTYGFGHKVMDNPYRSLMGISSGTPSALHRDATKAWQSAPAGMTETSPDRINKNIIPVLDPTFSSDNNATSSRWLIKGDYLMFKNINLSYALPRTWIQSLDLSNVRLNVTAENLALLSARKGLNPQMNFTGEIDDQAGAPLVLSFGIKVDF
jgi:TonB-linked SusC/RagA family outer membrane protein